MFAVGAYLLAHHVASFRTSPHRIQSPAIHRTFTDAIHRTIQMDPLCVQIIDTPEFQRLRGLHQLGPNMYVFPSATHDRFQHSLGVAHLAGAWAEHFQRTQPNLQVSDTDVLCVRLAGLLHDLGHGPFSHFWEHEYVPKSISRQRDGGKRTFGAFCHEDVSVRMFDRLLEANKIDISPWLEPHDIVFVKELIGGLPPSHASGRLGTPGVLGEDKSFLYEIVANNVCGLDVDKLDYFERDSYFAGVVKVSFDSHRLMRLARIARADDRLHICFPEKCAHEVLHVFQTRFNLHIELYQHRVAQQIELMLCDALLLAEAHLPIYLPDGFPISLSECGSDADPLLDGFVQLSDAIIPILVAAASNPTAAAELRKAAELVMRVHQRKLYRFVGNVVLDPQDVNPSWKTPQGLNQIAAEIADIAHEIMLNSGLLSSSSSADVDRRFHSKLLRVKLRRVNYGRGEDNPLEKVFFFDNKRRQMRPGSRISRKNLVINKGISKLVQEDVASHSKGSVDSNDRRVLEAYLSPRFSSNAAQLPRAFQESSLRLFITEPDSELFEVARVAFEVWCDEHGLCEGDEECVIRGLEIEEKTEV